jgi:hypothetical protein
LGVIDGDYRKENELHRMFGKYREQREWFRLEEEIINYIDGNCKKIFDKVNTPN